MIKTNYLKKVIFFSVMTTLYLIFVNRMQHQEIVIWVHFGYYMIIGICLYFLDEFSELFHSLCEQFHYFSFLKRVLLTISISMLIGYLSQFILLGIESVGKGFLIPVGDQIMMTVWFITLALLKPIGDALLYHKVFVVLDNKKVACITIFISLLLQAVMNMGSIEGGGLIFLISIPPMVSYYITKDITVSLTAQFLVNLANFISLYLFFL